MDTTHSPPQSRYWNSVSPGAFIMCSISSRSSTVFKDGSWLYSTHFISPSSDDVSVPAHSTALNSSTTYRPASIGNCLTPTNLVPDRQPCFFPHLPDYSVYKRFSRRHMPARQRPTVPVFLFPVLQQHFAAVLQQTHHGQFHIFCSVHAPIPIIPVFAHCVFLPCCFHCSKEETAAQPVFPQQNQRQMLSVRAASCQKAPWSIAIKSLISLNCGCSNSIRSVNAAATSCLQSSGYGQSQ